MGNEAFMVGGDHQTLNYRLIRKALPADRWPVGGQIGLAVPLTLGLNVLGLENRSRPGKPSGQKPPKR